MSKNKEIKDLDVLMASMHKTIIVMNFAVRFHLWYKRIGDIISSITGAIIGSAWASTLIIYICTNNTFWLKVFFGFIAVILIIAFQMMWFNALMKYQSNKGAIKDMSKMDNPDADDVNLKVFDEYKNFKYRVTDKHDPQYNKQFFLYPMYGRWNSNGTIMVFKSTQIIQTTEEK